MCARIRALADAGIPVMGHLGLTPQTATALGGWKAQGRTGARRPASCATPSTSSGPAPSRSSSSASRLGSPRPSARGSPSPRSASARAPGATARCSCSTTCSACTRAPRPRFVKRYADLRSVALDAVRRYAEDVRSGAFPEDVHGYAIADEELARFHELAAGVEGHVA